MQHLQNGKLLSLLNVPSRWWYLWRLAATSEWIAFLCGYCSGSLHRTKYCVYSIIHKRGLFWVLFMVSNENAYSQWISCLETFITYHMYLLWHGRVWHHRLRHMGRYIWYNNIPLQTSIGNFKSEPILRKFVFYSNKGVLQEDGTVENISVDISSSQYDFKSYCKFVDGHFNDAIEKSYMDEFIRNKYRISRIQERTFLLLYEMQFCCHTNIGNKKYLVHVDPDLLFISKYAFQAGENCLSTDTAGRSQNEGNRSFVLFIQ